MKKKSIVPELRPCPICGGKGEFRKVNIWGKDAYQIECRLCHLTTKPVIVGVTGVGGNSYIYHITLTDARHNAAIDWNCIRVHNAAWREEISQYKMPARSVKEERHHE